MKVIKRNGQQEELNITQIRKQTIPACAGLKNVSIEELELSAQIIFQDGIKTSDIQQSLIDTAKSKVDVQCPEWTYVAQRLSLYDLYHNIKRYYSRPGSGDVYEKVTLDLYIIRNKDILSNWFTKYTDEEIEELNSYIDPKRDLLFDYAGFELMKKMYLAKNRGDIVELPQHMHMSIAMFAMQDENKEKRLQYIKEYYDITSKLEFVNATPINANARLSMGSYISCILVSVGDSTDRIMDIAKEVAFASKQGSGVGIDIARIRSVGSSIGYHTNAAGGKIPFMKIYNDIALAFDQNGKRQGAFALNTESWDLEVFDFIDTRKTNGDERRRAHNIQLCISYSDLHMKRAMENGDWTLFDPADVPLLTEHWGDKFEKEYLKYEKRYQEQPELFNPNTKVVKARDVLQYHFNSWCDVGVPYFLFKDNANRNYKYNNINIIRQSNLCNEIIQPTGDDYTGVCNLGSINLSRINNTEDLERITKLALRALDNYIDLTPYPSDKARRFQDDYRSTGIGSMGEAEYLANSKIYYGSDEHKEQIDRIWKTISDTSLSYSQELAKEKGGCGIDKSVRNALRHAIAPNSSSAIFAGTTNGLEPVYAQAWVEVTKKGQTIITAPHLSLDNAEYYKNAFEVDMIKQLEINAIRGKYIDMSQSQNLFIQPDENGNISIGRLSKCVFTAWKLGIKTLYYLRTKAPKNNICFNCEN